MDDVAAATRRSLRWLERTQHRDGHWDGESPLSTVHATTRCLRVFVGCGFPRDYPVVQRATKWLIRPEAESVFHFFWRLGVLSELPDAPRDVVTHDFDVVCQTISNGLKLDRKLSYHAFLFDCAASCGQADNFPDQGDELVEELTRAGQQFTPTLWGYVGLERAGRRPAYVESRVTELLFTTLQDQNGARHINGSVVETSFFVFNVCRSPSLGDNPAIASAVLGAVRWILSRQTAEGNWPIEPPVYNGDPQCMPYVTGIAARALIEFLRRYDPPRLCTVFIPDWRLRRALVAGLRWSCGLLLCVAVAAVGVFALPQGWGVVTTAIGTVAALLDISVFVTQWRKRLLA